MHLFPKHDLTWGCNRSSFHYAHTDGKHLRGLARKCILHPVCRHIRLSKWNDLVRRCQVWAVTLGLGLLSHRKASLSMLIQRPSVFFATPGVNTRTIPWAAAIVAGSVGVWDESRLARIPLDRIEGFCALALLVGILPRHQIDYRWEIWNSNWQMIIDQELIKWSSAFR